MHRLDVRDERRSPDQHLLAHVTLEDGLAFLVSADVFLSQLLGFERLLADLAGEGDGGRLRRRLVLPLRADGQVLRLVRQLYEAFFAVRTVVRSRRSVVPLVAIQGGARGEGALADGAHVRTFACNRIKRG